MQLIDWLAFVALSVVGNTPVPLAFDPIMLEFARTHPDQAWAAAVAGAIGAGVGGTLEMVAFRALGRRYPEVGRGFFKAPSGPWFYPWTAGMAVLPIPFGVVRLAAFLTRANPILYGLAVAAGRLPRHAAIVALSASLSIPASVGPLLVLLAISPILWMLIRFTFTANNADNRRASAEIGTYNLRTESGECPYSLELLDKSAVSTSARIGQSSAGTTSY